VDGESDDRAISDRARLAETRYAGDEEAWTGETSGVCVLKAGKSEECLLRDTKSAEGTEERKLEI
jgi:hypothetical protein